MDFFVDSREGTKSFHLVAELERFLLHFNAHNRVLLEQGR